MRPGVSSYPKDTRFVCYNVINKGLRPVTITRAGGRLKDDREFIINPMGFPNGVGRLPYEMKDGQSYSMLVLQSEVQDQLSNIDCFLVCDATGKMFNARLNRKLKRQFNKK